MDFFRSILADDPEPPQTLQQSESNNQLPNHQQTEVHSDHDDDDSTSNVNSSENSSAGSLWSFGDLVKTLTTKSESVIETYRRDLKDFGTGLRNESDLFRQVASRAVKDLPSSSTSAIDGVLKSTADIIAQSKEAFIKPNDADDSDASEKLINNDINNRSGLDLKLYSRFDVKLNEIRSDRLTYCEDPEDLGDYDKWKLGFVIDDKRSEIERLVGENGELVGMYGKLVPNEVDEGMFWFRYFYKVRKLKLQEDMRAKPVKRSLSVDDEEEDLSWDVDEDDDVDDVNIEHKQQGDQLMSSASKGEDLDDEVKAQSSKVVDEDDKNRDESVVKSNEKVDMKVDSAEVKDKDRNVVVESNQPSFREDDDIGWDEIEDLGDDDDRKVSHGDADASKAALRTRLATAADEEDLNWDIEDDDEEDDKTVKPGDK
ncbi:uncharacterized protein LOC143625810 [Bidens hawaiensis]|uniref:uncharacterized protein LOC143625810 n=1 Tax=Bidens hawaiensis TaxID=980011 RepID=UPI00404ADB52